MSTQLFLRTGTTVNAGTLPSGSQSATTPTVTATGGTTNRNLSRGIGGAVQNLTVTTSATTSAQNELMGMFQSEPLLGSGTFGGGTCTFDMAEQESNSNANFWINAMECYVWRPSTGAKVGTVKAMGAASLGGLAPTAITQTQTTHITGVTTSAVAYADGDIIVVEIWVRSTQAMATAYTGGLYYDGATAITAENTVLATPASCITFSESVIFKGGLAPTDVCTAGVTLSNSNLTATIASAAAVVTSCRSATSRSTGKYYWQAHIDSKGTTGAGTVGPIGIADLATSISVRSGSSWWGSTAATWGLWDDGNIYHNGTGTATGLTVAAGKWSRCALNLDAGKGWFGDEAGWASGGDPVAGTTPTFTFTANTQFWVGVGAGAGAGTDVITLNLGGSAFNNAIPSGYTSWDGSQGAGPTTHAATGAITGAGAAIAGTAARKAKHATTGALTGPGAALAGTARRTRVHPSAGALAGPGAVISGQADNPGGAGAASGDYLIRSRRRGRR